MRSKLHIQFFTIILIYIFSVLVNDSAFGQGYHAIVVLNTNKIITGELLDITPDTLKIRDTGMDSVLVFKGSEISTVYLKELNKSIKYPITDTTNIFVKNEQPQSEMYTLPGNKFELGLGLVEGSEYKKYMQRVFSNISGGGYWVYLDIGYSIHIAELFYLTPRVAVLWSSVSTVIEGFEYAPNKKGNYVLLPGISGRYYLNMILPDLYTHLFLSPIFPFSDFKNIQLNSGGVSLGVGVGYFFGDRYELEFGYLSVPIEAGNSYQIISNSDFGGAKLLFRGKF